MKLKQFPENALWLERLFAYRNSENAVTTMSTLIDVKVRQQYRLLKKYGSHAQPTPCKAYTSYEAVLLCEARNAKQYWHHFAELVPFWTIFKSRIPHGDDVTNQLLDIGYHQLAGKVRNILTAHNIPPSISLLHRAHRSDGEPLVYDLMELFRADLVDAEVLRFLRMKKKPMKRLVSKQVEYFLHRMNKRMEKKHYLREFEQCHTYAYIMELQILKFIKAVNHTKPFHPIKLPTRHDDRCTNA